MTRTESRRVIDAGGQLVTAAGKASLYLPGRQFIGSTDMFSVDINVRRSAASSRGWQGTVTDVVVALFHFFNVIAPVGEQFACASATRAANFNLGTDWPSLGANMVVPHGCGELQTFNTMRPRPSGVCAIEPKFGGIDIPSRDGGHSTSSGSAAHPISRK